jgi:hypothetical protein
MPTLARFTFNLAWFGLLVYGGMFALVTFVAPKEREIVTTVPVEMRSGDKPDTNPGPLMTMEKIQAHQRHLFTALENFPFEER